MTHEDIVYDRRVRLINYAAEIGNVTRACRVFGVSRKTYYQWLAKAEQYGLSALLPKERRTPHQPNAMSIEEVSVILAEAVARPTLGARSLLRHLHARGVHRSASGVAKVLHRHNLGTARLRVAALASLTAADSGQVTDAAMEGPFGFCLFASRPGQVVSLDTFYGWYQMVCVSEGVANLKEFDCEHDQASEEGRCRARGSPVASGAVHRRDAGPVDGCHG